MENMNKLFLSKSDYILGDYCPKALWLKKHRKELLVSSSDTWSSNGYDIQKLAQKLYPSGILINSQSWEVPKGAELTKELSQKHSVLFEAVTKLDNGAFCRIDILEKTVQGWNLIEIKSTKDVTDKQLTDLAYQYYIFKNAGYHINCCYILHLNKAYIRRKQLNVKKLFVCDDVTAEVKERYPGIEETTTNLLKYQNKRIEPKVKISKSCQGCDFYNYCCCKVPEYSIWNLFNVAIADEICERLNSYDIHDLTANDYDTKVKIDITSWQKQKIHCDKIQIKSFLKKLVYPLYYLDYETIMPAIPLFSGSQSYQQIPFQFSLHIQKEPNGVVEHISFLHKEKTDPRRDLAESLVKHCGNKGSVIVYNESFEKNRNKELAEFFPDLASKILMINERIVDLLVPFRNRYLYHYNQHSSASIKKVLPSFTNLNYDDMEIHNGSEAMERYSAFIRGELTKEEEQILFDGLDKYCEQDTYAMVLLMKVLYQKSK